MPKPPKEDNPNKPPKQDKPTKPPVEVVEPPPTEVVEPPTEIIEPPPVEVVEPPPVEVVEPPPTEITPPPSGESSGIPLSFDDPMFTGMTEKSSRVTLDNGDNLSKTSIKETSGEPSIISNGDNTVSYCRVQSRECVRITDDDLTVENCYLEAKGTGDDHADTLQAYSPGARGGTVTLRNTHVRAFNEAATAGYFTADNWGGTIKCENVIFQGGPFGIRANSDTGCHIDVYMKDVFFVGPFGYDPFLFGEYGGTLSIEQWENVCEATIVGGKLVPGNAMNRPDSAAMSAAAASAPPVPPRKK